MSKATVPASCSRQGHTQNAGLLIGQFPEQNSLGGQAPQSDATVE